MILALLGTIAKIVSIHSMKTDLLPRVMVELLKLSEGKIFGNIKALRA